MLKMSTKIVHWFVLLMTGVALIGVNVRQLYCCHSENTHLEVRIVPEEDSCPCDDGCCGGKDCHNTARHNFYKITDDSKTEAGIRFEMLSFYLPEYPREILPDLSVPQQQYSLFRHEIPLNSHRRELLCTYLC